MQQKVSEPPTLYNAVTLLENNLAERSEKIAIYSSQRTVTYSQLAYEANQLGNALIDRDICFGDCVGILLPDSPEWVASFFGTIKIGAIAVCLNTALSPKEYDFIFKDCRLKALIIHESLLALVDSINLPFKQIVVGQSNLREDDSYKEITCQASSKLLTAQTHRDDFCSLHYSSGTTGRPKGMYHAHKDYLYIAKNTGIEFMGLKEEDRTFSVSKLFFVYGLGGNLVMPFHVGASIVLFSGSTRIGAAILETIQQFRPTVLISIPTAYISCLALGKRLTKYDLSSLRLCLSAGEVLPASLWYQWKEKTKLEILDTIGCTETFHTFMANRPDNIRPGSSGKPTPGYEVKIVNEEGKQVTTGEIGNLMVKGDSTVLFYLHQYEKSRQTFQGEWLLTGDKYYQDKDGFYWYVGRTDDLFKVGGLWVSPIEIEQVIITHSKVRDCAVVLQLDNQQMIKPKAFICLNTQLSSTPTILKELIEYCSKRLPTYKSPRWIEFVEELPRTATGKLQRFKLKNSNKKNEI